MATRGKKGTKKRRAAAGPVEPPPVVVLDVEVRDGLFFVLLRNAGAGSARDVSVRWAQPLRGMQGERDVAALFRALPYLAPGREHRVLVDRWSDYLRRGESLLLTAALAWRDAAGRRHADLIRHDLTVLSDLGDSHGC